MTRAYVTSILLARANTPIPRLHGTLGNLIRTLAKAARKAARAIHQALAATKAEKVTATLDLNHLNVQSKQIGANFAGSIFKGECKKGNKCPQHHNGPCKFHSAGTCTKGDKCLFTHWNSSGAAVPAVDPKSGDGKPLTGKAAKAAAAKAKAANENA